MPGTDDLQAFIEERLLSYDPDIDLSPGAPASVEIIEPLIARFTPDPFEIDIPTFIRTRLSQEYPNLSVEEGDALTDMLVKPMEVLIDPIIREVNFLRTNKSLSNPELLAPAEADSLMGNIFLSRERGDYAQGNVRLYFNAPTSVNVGVSNIASTPSGLIFYPTTPQAISAESMLFNQSGNLFYFDITLRSAEPGEEYNVGAGEITSITGIPGVVRVSNLFRFTGGLPEESTAEFVDRGSLSVIERSLVVPRGAYARLFDQFTGLQHLQVIGYGDEEMDRDVITGGALGRSLLYGVDGLTTDDGDGDGSSTIFSSPTGGFLDLFGAATAVTGYYLVLKGRDYPIVFVQSDDTLIISADEEGILPPDYLTNAEFSIRKYEITLSNIPGGIVFPNGANGTLTVVPNEVHIGSMMDFLVAGDGLEEKTMTLKAVTDQEPLIVAEDLSTKLVGFPADIVFSPSVNFLSEGVTPGKTLIIESGSDVGSYSVLTAAPGSLNGNYLQVSPEPSVTATGLKFKIVDAIDMSLSDPVILRGEGGDLKTILGSEQVSTVAGVDFSLMGVQEGDVLEIFGEGENAGRHIIQRVTGYGNMLLILEEPLKKTSNSEQWAVYYAQTGIELPVIRIAGVELLDANLQPTGEIVPYANPVDLQSEQFSNSGVGEKLSVNDAKVGIVGSVDLSTGAAAVNGKTLKLSINAGATVTILFSGVTSAQDIVDQINLGVSGYYVAGLLVVDVDTRLVIRSRVNWIQVLPTGSANPFLGLSVTDIEDNRQIISASIGDWTAQGIYPESDVAFLTGAGAGYWFIQQITLGKVFVLNVENGTVSFPSPGVEQNIVFGSRSFGVIRCYFLNPTTFQVRGSYRGAALPPSLHVANTVLGSFYLTEAERTEFVYDEVGVGSLRFYPDPEMRFTFAPVEGEDVPNNLSIEAGTRWVTSDNSPSTGPGKYSRSALMDFLEREALPGDILKITHSPIQGTVDIRSTPSGAITYPTDVVGKTLRVNIQGGSVDRVVTFTSASVDETTLVEEINTQLGLTIAYIENTGTEKYLRLEADFDFIVRDLSTCIVTDVFGLAAQPRTNKAPAFGEYVINQVGEIVGSVSSHNRLYLSERIGDPSWTTFTAGQVGPSQHFSLIHPGVQRISSTAMEANFDGTLYYADIEVVSEGVGNVFNLAESKKLNVFGHQSDGYLISNENPMLAFSMAESLNIRLSRRFLPVGNTDTPSNLSLMTGQNIKINYFVESLVSSIQNFSSSELDRVLNANILVKHLTPHFIYFTADFQGGSSESIIMSDIEDYIKGVGPSEVVEVSAIAEIIKRRGATRLTLPITLLAVVHESTRGIRVDRSQDSISSGRLSTFIPGVITLTRNLV